MRITSSTHAVPQLHFRSTRFRRHTRGRRWCRPLDFQALEERVLPATIMWKAPVDGNFSEGSNWVGGQAPGPNDTAVIDATTGHYTVTLDANSTVAGFTLNAADCEFHLTGRTFAVNGPAMIDAGLVALVDSTWAGTGTLTNNAGLIANHTATISRLLGDHHRAAPPPSPRPSPRRGEGERRSPPRWLPCAVEA
jgi:hypothetical protein